MNTAMKLACGAVCALAALASSATGLPAGYTRVAGLQSAGISGNAPYIDLGYAPTQNTRVDIDFSVLAWGGGSGSGGLDNYPCPFGACHDGNALAFTLTGGATQNDGNCWSYRWGDGTTDGIIIQKSLITGKHHLEANGPLWTIDGLAKEKTGGSSETFTMNKSLFVFARNNNGKMDHPVKMALYGFDIYESGELRHSFMPCVRNSDGEPGLYDVAGDKGFLAKSGTGAFTIAGLPTGYTRVAGLQSAGVSGSDAPYIDLGYKPTQNTRVDIDFDLLAWGSSSGLAPYPCPFGTCHATNALAFTLTGGPTAKDGNCWSYRWGNGSSAVIIPGSIITGAHQLEANGTLWTIDGLTTNKTGGASETFTMTKNLYVFGRNNNGTMDQPVNMTLYGFDIYESGVLLHSFVPCVRNSDNAPGLYDIVGNKGFLAKSGTGAFSTVETSCLEMEGIPSAVSNPNCHPKPVVHPLGDISTDLVEGTDYTLGYGTSSLNGYTNKWVKATGIGDYDGVVSRKAWYRVVAQSTSAFSVERIAPVAYEDGQPGTPHPVVRTADESRTLAEGIDYDLSWYGNREIGRGYAVISGRGGFAGEIWTEPFSILPALRGGYRAAEYIRSSGTQYIDTGFKPGVDTRADFHFDMEEFGGWSQWAVPFGSRNDSSYQFFVGAARQLYNGEPRDDWYRRFSNKDISSASTSRGKPPVVGEHFFSLNKATYTLDDYTDTFTGYNHFQKTYNAYVFAVNNNNAAANHSPMKLYSLKIWDDGTLVREFVPCVRNDGEAGLYDITPGAEKKFYANGGTGTFEAGPVLESPSTPMVICIR